MTLDRLILCFALAVCLAWLMLDGQRLIAPETYICAHDVYRCR